VEELRAGRNPLDDGGIVALLAGEEQHAVLMQVQGMMSLLEGHGDVTMNRAAGGRIPEAARFHRTLHDRRRQTTPPARLLQKVLGLEAKLKQYEQGERFIAAVEAAGGPELFECIWDGPENLPTLPEVRDPHLWLERVRPAAALGR
jgi:putative hydrolase